jgi:UDP-N-acetylmuramoylalanine--D-glutamate ligase
VTEKFRACLDAPHVPDLPAAFALAVEKCAKKGAILLAPGCASAEPYANFKERGDHFRDIAKEWLEI